MQSKGKKKYVRKQDTQSQVYQKQTVKQPRNPSQLEPQTKRNTKKILVQSFDDAQFQTNDKSYKFSYKFNEYVRLSLVKILPPKCKKLVIKKAEQSLVGPQNDCQNFIKSIKAELQNFVVKIIKVEDEMDIDEIQFHLNPQYQVKVYRIKYVELAATDISTPYGFKEEANNLIKKMTNENQILIRIRKQYSQDCMNDINEIVKRQKKITRQQHSLEAMSLSKVQIASHNDSRIDDTGMTNTMYQSHSFSGSIHEDQDQPSYYQIQKLKESSAKVKKQKEHNSSRKNHSCVNLMNKLPEPYEDDSVSVVQKKKKYEIKQVRNMKKKQDYPQQYTSKAKYQKKNTKQLKKYEFEGSDFDERHFMDWLKDKRILDKNQVIIQKREDPYDENMVSYIIRLKVDDDLSLQSQSQKQEAFQIYFKYKKVIFLKMKNQTYKKQMIEDQNCEDNAIKVEYVKGYKSPKWNQSTMWRHILRKDYTVEKRSANTEFFQAFYIEGLMNIVRDTQAKIKKMIEKQPKNDVLEQIMFTLNQVASQIRDNKKVQTLLDEHIRYIIVNFFKHLCSVKQINFVLSGVKIILLVKFDQHGNFVSNIKGQITAKLKSQLKINPYQSNVIIDKFTYEKLQKKLVILQKKQKSFTFLCKNVDIATMFNTISSIFNSMNTISQKQIIIQDFLLGKKMQEKIKQLIDIVQFSEIKFNSVVNNKKIHVFKLYGRSVRLDQMEQLINQFKDAQLKNRLSYHQITMLKQKEISEDQDLIEKIHKKYSVFLLPTEGIIDCRITLVNQNPNYKKKYIFIKNTNNLDYAPLNSTILFRNINQIEAFEMGWMKTTKNWFKKQGNNTPFKQKNRNYTIMLKSNLSSSEMLKSTLDANLAITNILFLMPQYDKKQFILQLLKSLSQEKKYDQRELNLYLVQLDTTTNFQQVFGFQAYSRESKKKTKLQEKIVKYYVSDGANVFYYSKSGNEKILEALDKKKNSVILNNEDLNISHTSHKYVRQTSSILHLQSNKSFPVQVYPNKVSFTLNQQTFQMPSTQGFKVLQCINLNMTQADLSLGVYQIKFDSMQQINLFSGFTRKLSKQENIVKVDKIIEKMQVEYNVKVGQIVYQYSSQESSLDILNKSVRQVNQFISSKVKTRQFSLKQLSNLTKQQIQTIIAEIQEDQSIQCKYNDDDQSLFIKLFDDNEFLKIEWKIKLLENASLSKKIKEEVRYPSFWQLQKDSIQQFIVPAVTAEFKKVQDRFKIGPIKCLIRIQNQIIYKKYYDEGQFLKNLNDGTPVRTMELFHGTRSTNPEDIYKDKEESFNINYSSDSNLLGRGIYFAEKCEYSDGYKHTQIIDNTAKVLGIFGSNRVNSYSMFLCEVYVGQSQKCKGHNGAIKDTSYRDVNKKIRYQSMTDYLNQSDIYVVYKSRRAYPLYLIKY